MPRPLSLLRHLGREERGGAPESGPHLPLASSPVAVQEACIPETIHLEYLAISLYGFFVKISCKACNEWLTFLPAAQGYFY